MPEVLGSEPETFPTNWTGLMSHRFVLPLLLAFGVVAAACGGAATDTGVVSLDIDSVGTQAENDDRSAVDEESVLAFTACLRDEGLVIDDPGVDDDGNLVLPTPHAVVGQTLDPATVHAAFDACSGLLEGVVSEFEMEDLSQREDELLAFAVCMRENGYDMPDPDFSDNGHGGDGPFGDAIDADDPAFQTAAQSCEGIIGG